MTQVNLGDHRAFIRCAHQQLQDTNGFEGVDAVYIMEPGTHFIEISLTAKWQGIDKISLQLNRTIVCGGQNYRIGAFSFKDWMTGEMRKYMIASQFFR